ncbi:MAG: type II secretion system F family protein [Nanoarchaeota archaeon]|nr:type II secretion system F family protein [Nanoarchaeota archaeon]
MELKQIHWGGIIAAAIIISASFLFYGKGIFFFLIGIGVIAGVSPFVINMINEARINSEKEEMFLEFARNLVESVKTGTPISKSIVNMRNKPYGVLTEHIKKLANQISMGIPLNQSLRVFSGDVDNKAISRALTLIGQAERAGGDIGEILESVAGAVSMSDKLKKERKAVISSLVVQGYIIFLVFMVIILVMQFKILPMLSGIAEVGSLGSGGIESIGTQVGGAQTEDITGSFLYLLIIQGLFTGLVIGKLAEGTIKAGIRHSFSLMLLSFLISNIAGLIL